MAVTYSLSLAAVTRTRPASLCGLLHPTAPIPRCLYYTSFGQASHPTTYTTHPSNQHKIDQSRAGMLVMSNSSIFGVVVRPPDHQNNIQESDPKSEFKFEQLFSPTRLQHNSEDSNIQPPANACSPATHIVLGTGAQGHDRVMLAVLHAPHRRTALKLGDVHCTPLTPSHTVTQL